MEIGWRLTSRSWTSRPAESDEQPILRCAIGPIFSSIQDTGTRLVIHNLGTRRNVSFAGVEIINVKNEDDPARAISVSSTDVQVDGAWEIEDRDGVKSLEDRNNHKGQSTITVPLTVEIEGRYRVKLLWRANPGNANNVLMELFAEGAGNQLVSSIEAEIPDPGEARFYYDCADDSVAFFQPEPVFQFDDMATLRSPTGGRQRVTAGAVEFLQHSDPARRFLVDSLQAEGNERWQDSMGADSMPTTSKGKSFTTTTNKKESCRCARPSKRWTPQMIRKN